MNFREYAAQARTTATYPGRGTAAGLSYVGLGLGEAGEVQGKIKKVLRDDDGILTDDVRLALSKELGDLLWYVSQAADEIGVPLDAIARQNLAKLASRAERGVLGGSGDDR